MNNITQMLIPKTLRRTLKIKLHKYGLISADATLHNLRCSGYNPSTIIDVGAYDGAFAGKIQLIYPDANLILFEAQRAKALALQQRYRRVYCEVLGSRDGDDVTFYNLETGSSYYPQVGNCSGIPEERKTRTLDSVLDVINAKELGSQCFIKIDTQGSELDILCGAKQLLEHTDFIFIELSLVKYNQNAPLYNKAIEKLEQLGFGLFDIAWIERLGSAQALQFDALFCRAGSASWKMFKYHR